jgi:hypothetical protein
MRQTVGTGSTNTSELCPVAQFCSSGITFRVLIPDRLPVSYLKLDICCSRMLRSVVGSKSLSFRDNLSVISSRVMQSKRHSSRTA